MAERHQKPAGWKMMYANANDYLVLEAKSVDNEKIKAEYDIAKKQKI